MKFSGEKKALTQTLHTIKNRKLLILFVFLLVVISGMIATFLITPKYEATMSILVSRDRIDPQISPSEKLPDTPPTSVSDEEFNSEIELIKSSQVLTGAVAELNLIDNTTPSSESSSSRLRNKIKTMLYRLTSGETVKAEEAPKKANDAANVKSADEEFTIEKTVGRVAGNLDVVPIKKSRIIKINYTDTDPIRAKNTLEKIYQKYVELHVHLNEKKQAGEVFNNQTDNYNRKLKSSTNVLKKFDVENGISGAQTNVQRELLLKQLFETQAQLSTTQTEIIETEHRITDLQEKVNSQPEQIQTGSVSKYVSALDRMKEELTQLEQQRTQLLQKYQPNSRLVRENEGRIQQLKKSLAEETANPPQEKSFALNDLRRRLVTDLFNAQTNLVALKEREKKLTPLVAKLRDQSTQLNSKSIERENLERTVNVNEEAYLLYQKKARENEISQILNKEQVVNFSLVDAPRTDGEQKNPKPLLNLMILIVLGSISGFASAIVLDALAKPASNNKFITSAIEIESCWNLPVLATVPVIKPLKKINVLTNPKRISLLTAAEDGKK